MSAPRVNWRQAAGEALLLLVGVGVALSGQAWWEYRIERDLEQHVLQGIRSDLERDSADIRGASLSAEFRAAGADQLLSLVGDPQGVVPLGRGGSGRNQRPGVENGDEILQQIRAAYPELSATEALRRLGSLQRFDLADAAYSEATASGQLDVIQDVELRAAIGNYYFDAGRNGVTNDDRVEANAQQLRIRLADSGLSPEGAASDEVVLRALRADDSLKAELRNVRGFAVLQIRLLGVIDYDRGALAADLDEWLRVHR